MRNKILSLIIWIGLTAAVSLFLYPTFMNSLANISQVISIGDYQSELNAMADGTLDAEREKARKYNETIWEEQQEEYFFYRGEEATDELYDSTLNLVADHTMGYIEVPGLAIYLPITHGTRSQDLDYRAGHMYGTSLPIGGENTHAVISAHTGLTTATLFTRLTEMKEGDKFYIHILGESHVYTVDQITVCLPEEESEFIQIEEGKDLVTLYTCTPYGINDHRLLVRGERTYPDLISDNSGGQGMSVISKDKQAILLTVVIGLIPIAILIFGLIRTFRKPRNTNKERP